MTSNDAPKQKQAIALISGGKDSFLSLYHAALNGYTIVALANLHPPLSTAPPQTTVHHSHNAPAPSAPAHISDELDSYMYQTIGHTLLPLYASCLNVPLYRRPITGSHTNADLNYHPAENDETEDLFALLEDVMVAFPGVQVVTSGAILSTYQRTRVESVCSRLGLQSLAYLWRMPQTEVLGQLGELGYDARIVKTAALGLDESWLWKSVASTEVVRKLEALERKWGVNVAGEGGEYETLVVSAPGWVGEIVVGEDERLVKDDGGASWLEFMGATVRVKEPTTAQLKERTIYDPEFSGLLVDVSGLGLEHTAKPAPVFPYLPTASAVLTQHTLQLLNITAPGSPNPLEELTEIFNILTSLLASYSLKLTSISHIHLHLSTISLFGPLNALYSTFFRAPLPPSRVTTSTPLPAGTNILISATAALSQPTGLHVQSISYWAPCNIGPYSQAQVLANGWVETAGMIPLVPASMDMVAGGIWEEAVLGLQHVARVWDAVGAVGMGMVCWVTRADMVRIVGEVWRRSGKSGDLVVVWAEELPRGVSVEWEGIARTIADDEEEEGEAEWRVKFGMDGREVEGVAGGEVVLFAGLDKGMDTKDGVRVVPTRRVWDADGKDWDWAMATRSRM